MLDIIKSGRRYDKDYEFTGAEGNLISRLLPQNLTFQQDFV